MMKTKTIRIGLLVALSSAACAQVYTPPQPGATQGTPTDTTTTVNRQQPQSKSPFGEEIPLLNPGDETVTVAGMTIPLGDNRILRARFEKYLSQPPEDSKGAKDYRANIDQILADLSPYRKAGPDIRAAFKTLPAAAAFPADARICMTLAEAVYVAMLARKDNANLHKINEGLEEEKQERIRDGDWKTRHDRDPKTGDTNSSGQGADQKNQKNKEATSIGRGANSLEYAEILRRIAEVEIMKKKNLAQSEVQILQTKIQYQANMALWTMQRRYQHVLMASRFYNQIWKDGDTALHLDKNSDVSKMFSESLGVNPTVSTLDSVANEAIQEVNKAIEAVTFLLEREEIHTASKRLMEAYIIGEYLAPVATLEREKKRRIQLYVRDLYDLYGAMQARNYLTAKKLVDRLNEVAKDFPSAKAESAIAGYTLASDLSVETAKTYLLAGEREKAAQEFKAAAEIWPTNPKLDEFKDLIQKSSVLVTTRNDFDRLRSEENYREIFKRQYEFAPIVKGDEIREDTLTQIIRNIHRIDGAILVATQAASHGNSFAAWEALATLREEFPDDPKLGREIETLTPKVSTFVNALERAKNFENRRQQQTGSAIAWYLRAKRIYPDSEMAEEGFQRLLEKVLPEGDLSPAAAKSARESGEANYN
jgi:tetratricopeptide (TPR) repeat protein